MHHPTDRIAHTTAFVTPVVEHRLERQIAQWVHSHEESIRRPIAPWASNRKGISSSTGALSSWTTSSVGVSSVVVGPLIPMGNAVNPVTSNCIGRKDNIYLTTHSTHFILRLYGVGHMVKDHSDSERGNPLPLTWATLSDLQQGLFCYNALSHRQDSTYHGL